MKKRYRFIERKVYRNMFLNILILTSFFIMIVSTVLFVLFSRSSVREVGAMSKSMLSQTSYAADIIEAQVQTVGNQLINERSVTNAMFNREVDRVQEYAVVGLLNRLQAVYTFIDYIGVYNEYTGRYLNTKGLEASDEKPLLDDTERLGNSNYANLIPRQVTGGVRSREKALLTFVLTPGKVSYFPKKGAILVNIKQSYITNLLQGLRNESSNFLTVIDGKGTILGRTDSSKFLENASEEAYMKRLLASGQNSGSFVMNVEGEKSLVSYVKSEELEWFFVSVNRYDDILGNLIDLKRVVFAIALFMMAFSVLLIYWLTNRMYNPLDELIRKIGGGQRGGGSGDTRLNEFLLIGEAFHSVSEKARRLEPALFAAYKGQLLHYIRGSSTELLPGQTERIVGPKFRVILIKMDEYAAFEAAHNDKMQSVIRFAVCNISEEMTGLESVIVEEDEIALLEQLQDGEAPDRNRQLQEIQAALAGYFKLSVTIGIGELASSAEAIRDSYQSAKKALRNRFVDGIGRIHDAASDNGREEPQYAGAEWEALEQVIAGAVTGGGQELDAAVGKAAQLASTLTYDQALLQLNRLLNGLFQHFNKMPSTRDEAYAFLELAYSLISCETVDEAAKRMTAVCRSIGERLDYPARNRHGEIVDEIKRLIAREYSDPNLSLDAVTDRFQLTAGYLGKMFKSAIGVSFSDYLKETRLEKARELLAGTKWTAAEIGEKVGIYNSTYFYTLFKKRYGLSPAQYRADSLRGKADGGESR